ncbi:MAG: ABC transporter ATP-binding protein [Austwickia sp.]|jgi:putative spermidine/putrescine transport system ATP-binding protein|nr:MAG: ABC transporter ATP-binding protein [Austwickia sp.]
MTTSPDVPAAPGVPATHDVPALRLDGIHKRLGGRDIVTDLHLDVARGELVTLLGPSGCGKTTTLRMVAGFLKPDRGQVLVDGRDVTALNPERRPSAMVFQSYALWPHMTVFKNVAFPLKLDKVPGPELTRRVEAALDMVGLMHHRDSRPARISGGEQQRVALARALVQEPTLLLLDEPLSNLDAQLRVKVREEIREIQQRLGITTVLVTHDQEEALSISDRVAVMKDGRIEQLSPPAQLYADPRSEFVARFVGSLNTFPGRLVERADALTVAEEAGVVTGVRPEDVVILEGISDQAAQLERGAGGRAEGAGVAHRARVVRVVPHGPYAEIVLDLAGHRLSAFRSGTLPAEGSEVSVRLRRPMVFVDGVREDGPAGD